MRPGGIDRGSFLEPEQGHLQTATDRPEWAGRLRENLARVQGAIVAACARAGRDSRGVRLVAVTKYVALPIIRELLSAGVGELGENQVQQLVARANAFGSRLEGWPEAGLVPAASGSNTGLLTPRWHMIGHLQRNKVRQVLRYVRIIHSLDSLRLAGEVERIAAELDAQVDVLLEVNVSGEQSKYGLGPAEVPPLLEELRHYRRIRVHGLMTMAPFDPEPEHARPCFAQLREMLSALRQSGAAGPEFTQLSMGMSQDYEVAVEEGATLVRIGSALFEGLPQE